VFASQLHACGTVVVFFLCVSSVKVHSIVYCSRVLLRFSSGCVCSTAVGTARLSTCIRIFDPTMTAVRQAMLGLTCLQRAALTKVGPACACTNCVRGCVCVYSCAVPAETGWCEHMVWYVCVYATLACSVCIGDSPGVCSNRACCCVLVYAAQAGCAICCGRCISAAVHVAVLCPHAVRVVSHAVHCSCCCGILWQLCVGASACVIAWNAFSSCMLPYVLGYEDVYRLCACIAATSA
jgi:hypothetical protein